MENECIDDVPAIVVEARHYVRTWRPQIINVNSMRDEATLDKRYQHWLESQRSGVLPSSLERCHTNGSFRAAFGDESRESRSLCSLYSGSCSVGAQCTHEHRLRVLNTGSAPAALHHHRV